MPQGKDVITFLEYFTNNWIAIILLFFIFGAMVISFVRYLNNRDKKDDELRENFNKSVQEQLIKFDQGFMFFISNKNIFQFLMDNFEIYMEVAEFVKSGGVPLIDEFENTLNDFSERLKKNFGNGSDRDKAVQTILYGQNHLIEHISEAPIPDNLKPKFLVLTDFLIGKLMALLDQLEKIEERVQKPLLIDGNIRLLKMILNYFKIVVPSYSGKDDWEESLKMQLENKFSKYYAPDKKADTNIEEKFGVTM